MEKRETDKRETDIGKRLHRKHTTGHNSTTAPLWGLPKTWQDRWDRKITFLAQGTADGTAKNTGQETFLEQNFENW